MGISISLCLGQICSMKKMLESKFRGLWWSAIVLLDNSDTIDWLSMQPLIDVIRHCSHANSTSNHVWEFTNTEILKGVVGTSTLNVAPFLIHRTIIFFFTLFTSTCLQLWIYHALHASVWNGFFPLIHGLLRMHVWIFIGVLVINVYYKKGKLLKLFLSKSDVILYSMWVMHSRLYYLIFLRLKRMILSID